MSDGVETNEDDLTPLMRELGITDSELLIIGVGRKVGDITEDVGDSQARVIEKFGRCWEVVKDDVLLGKGGSVDELPRFIPRADKDIISENINWLREIAGGEKNWMRLREKVRKKGEEVKGGRRVDFVVLAAVLLFPKDEEKRAQLIDKAIDELVRVWPDDDRVSRQALRLPFFKEGELSGSLFGRALLRMRTAEKPEA